MILNTEFSYIINRYNKTKKNMSYEWLNEDSRVFLSRGYSKDGQSAEERISESANNAEKILGIEGFSDKFQSLTSEAK